ncbi:MAG: toxin-antitoxin system YwqK family antitoxin [Sphingobacteriaceae bacterium]|nr:toxin-antitoxin system YwqK family antitoxin [Sphingobacteriaceae bacterium]
MKKKYILIVSLLFPFFIIAQSGSIFVSVKCEDLVPENTERQINYEIAKMCKKVWEEKIGLGIGGPFGTYKRHVYDNNTIILRDGLGNIIEKQYKVKAIIVKKNGKCKVAYLKIGKAYQGGGVYGGFSGAFVEGAASPVECECADKLTDWLEGNTNSNETGESNVKRVKDVVPNKELSNGPYEEKGGDGLVYKTGQYDNGKKVGVWIYYGKGGKSAGKVEKEESYKDGEFDGTIKTFDENGLVTYSADYKNGKYNGKTKYYKSGALTMEEQNVDGQRNGKMIEYQSGKKWKETDFINAKKDGQEIYYFIENGKVKTITSYKDDKQNGSYKNFNKDGSLYEEGAFKDGYKEGEWKKYDAKGKVTEKIFYVKGEEEK